MNTVIFVQQRLNSGRLPNKARALIGSKTLTKHVVDRAAAVVGPENVVLSMPARDDTLWAEGYPCLPHSYGGRESDLIGRMGSAVDHWEAVSGKDADFVLRLTGDNPFVPEALIQAVISELHLAKVEAVETRSDPSHRPNGIDVQGMSRHILDLMLHEKMHGSWTEEQEEHVTPALHAITTVRTLQNGGGRALDNLPYFNVSVDTPEDLERARQIVKYVAHPNLEDLIYLRLSRPEIFV